MWSVPRCGVHTGYSTVTVVAVFSRIFTLYRASIVLGVSILHQTLIVLSCINSNLDKLEWKTSFGVAVHFFVQILFLPSHCVFLYSVLSWNFPPKCAQCASTVQTRNVFSKRLKAVLVAFGLQIGSGRLFQADGPSKAKAQRPHLLSQCRGTCSRFYWAERRCVWY